VCVCVEPFSAARLDVQDVCQVACAINKQQHPLPTLALPQ